MESANIPETACLHPGTEVGPWRVVKQRGQGSYGAVYRAVRVGLEAQGPVALKLALSPDDARFAREVELLSRVRHPAIPLLQDWGHWRHPSGASYPYVVMEWVEGTPLYQWADSHVPSSRTLLQWLAQLARALEATHAAGGLHRDVKGGNVLVRHQDARLFLMDFGSGHYRGASPLTGNELPPGTCAYRPPEAWLPRPPPAPSPWHSPGPADDVFALGVIGYRLVVGRYPPPTHPAHEDSFVWHQTRVGPHAPRAFNERCCPELSALLLRMLSVHPEARGSARELAEALEDAARRAGPEADKLLWAPVAPWLAQGRAGPEPVPPPAPVAPPMPVASPPAPSSLWRASWPLALTGALTLLALGYGARWLHSSEEATAGRCLPAVPLTRDGASAAVADSALEGSGNSSHARSASKPIAQKLPSKPLPGQAVPDANGRCRDDVEVPINGGCWVRLHVEDMSQCNPERYFEHQGGCYLPIFTPVRPSVSSPTPEGQRPEFHPYNK